MREWPQFSDHKLCPIRIRRPYIERVVRRLEYLLDEDYPTSRGQTVAGPGFPQSSGETTFDRYMRQQNDRIDNSICEGC
jgi:hypothetical protein